MKDFKDKTVIVTGGTSGIGLAVCERFASLGANVVCIARHTSDKFFSVCADVADERSAAAAVRAAVEKYGSADVLVNNAGFGISGAVEYTSAEDVRRIFDVNFTGVHNMCAAALPYLRMSCGSIINISSVAAQLAIPFQAYYSATKAAVSSFSEALRNEVAPFGVRVCCVLPGDVKTDFTSSRIKNADDGVYLMRAHRAVAAMERDERNGMAPQKVAEVVVKLAARKNPPVYRAVGAKYRLFVLLSRLLPSRLVNYIVGKLY